MIYNISKLILSKRGDDRMKNRILCFVILIVIALSGCTKKNAEEIVAYVGETPVTMAEYEFYLDNVKQQMQGTELSNDEDWQNKEIDGKKAIEVAKERALDIAAVNLAYIEIYEKMGRKFTDDDQIQIDAIKNDMVSQYSEGGYDEFLKTNNITDEFIDMLCKSTYCAEIFYNEIASENNVSQDELDALFEKFIEEKMQEFGIFAVETDAIKEIK